MVMFRKRFFPFLLLLVFISCNEIVVETPAGFAALETEDQYAAMSPEGMIYRVRVMKNSPKQSLEFWAEALTNHLQQEGYVRISNENDFHAGSARGSFSEWTVPYGSETYKYFTGVLVAEDTIAVAEASGAHDIYNRYRAALLKSLETIIFEDVAAKEVTVGEIPSSAGVVQKAESTPARSGGCFLVDTPVLTKDGMIPIDAVWPGTTLSVYDPLTDRWAEHDVQRTVGLAYTGDVITIEIGGKTVEVTGNHPFLVADGSRLKRRRLPEELPAIESLSPVAGRWVEARHLRKGDALLSLYGPRQRINSVSTRIAATRVYHLAVSGPHTYTIERTGIVVHNGGEQESAKAPVESASAVREREIIGGGAITASLPTDARSERIRVYSGACSIIIDRVEQAKRQIADMAEEVEGYVEQSSDRGIVIRVPAADFRIVFDDILELGEVLHKAIETYDVTDKFTDPTGRLAVAIRARDRLYVLLNRVDEAKERLDILKKIREYTETIERLELSLKVLEQRIAMSRITVDLHPRLAETETIDRPIPFGWVERLHPLYDSTGELGGKATVVLPEDVAIFQQKGVMRAEAADGTRIRIGTVKNDPRGDSLFWQQALLYHLRPRYQDAEAIALDSASIALFTSKDRSPYYYLVGAMPLHAEPTLVVFEVYFPDKAALDRHLEDLLDAFRQVEIK